jgi:signal peptidase I
MYSHSDVLVAQYQGRTTSFRVVATAGDQVDIREDGLYVNGYLQLEENIYEKTERFSEGVEFPLTVGEGEVFVLGDSRENSTDSRIFGPISIVETYGKVITIIRRRSI